MDEHQFIALVEQHRGAIERVCQSFCRGREADLDDMRQEALMALWRAWKRYRPVAAEVTWVWRVATNSCISFRRKQRRCLPTMPQIDFDLPDDTSLRDQCQQLREAVATLPAADARLASLYLDGWSVGEIAIMMGMSETNVTTRMSRIRTKLRNIYSHE